VNDGALALGKHLKLVYMHYIFVGICTPRTKCGAFMDFSLLAHEYRSMMPICPLEIACQNLFLQVCGFARVDSMSYAMVFWLGPIFACRSFVDVTRRVEKALSCCRGRVWLHAHECCTKHLILN
jgi:hypothetical protein